MISYQRHLAKLGGAGSVQRKPVFRSSAIFPAFRMPGVRTRLLFLGYWMVKRRIAQVHLVVTLRSQQGDLLHRHNRPITEPKAYRIELDDLLRELPLPEGSDFVGSVEVEFFAADDLIFTYPAVVVNYYGPTFSSVVHTSQRVFNDAEDRSHNLEKTVPEAGFTLYADMDREPFFTFINGFEEVKNGKVRMRFYNDRYEVLEHEMTVDRLRPYETTVVRPCDHVDLYGFLKGRPGTAKIEFDVSWVFPRVVSGNYQFSLQALSVTHTYYDCTEAADSVDYWREAEPGWLPASLMLPLALQGGRSTNITFYPIYSPSKMDIGVEIYSGAGELLAAEPRLMRLASPDASLHVVSLRELCQKHGVDTGQPLGAKLVASPADGSRLPARIKIGLDYGLKPDVLPCNICKTMDVFNPATEGKPRSFHWAPVMADCGDSAIYAVNGGPRAAYARDVRLELTFYREQDTATLVRSLRLAPNGTAVVRLSEDGELQDFMGGKIGWYTAVADNPYVNTYYVAENSTGAIGGDHDF
jgi:hypothetical protein